MQITDKVYEILEIKEILSDVFPKYPITFAAVFGSYARGEAKSGADIDLVIKTSDVMDLPTYHAFEEDIISRLHLRPDITFEDYINKFMREDILKEAVPIYEK
jgi:predicted nucleotidyltransferase